MEIAENFYFGTPHQKPNESISDFIVSIIIKQLSPLFNYGDFLSKAQRDQFVCGFIQSKKKKKNAEHGSKYRLVFPNDNYNFELPINGSLCTMEVETAADYSITSRST